MIARTLIPTDTALCFSHNLCYNLIKTYKKLKKFYLIILLLLLSFRFESGSSRLKLKSHAVLKLPEK